MAPVVGLWRLVRTAAAHDYKREAVISTSTAALLSVVFTSLYVLPFYLFRKTRPSPTLDRDAPSVIQARIRAVTVTVTLSTLTTFYLLHVRGQLGIEATLHHLGFWPISPLTTLEPLLLTLLLFLGPLYDHLYLQQGLSPLSNVWTQIITSLSSSIGYRNYIAGPLTEELLFRSSILPIHLLSPVATSKKHLIFLTPLYFGIAHVHHYYEFRLSHPDTPLLPAALRSIFQFAYTTIFGWFAAFVYLRTGDIYAVFFIHTFCNYMGLPRLWGQVQMRSQFSASYRAGKGRHAQTGRGKNDSERIQLSTELNSATGGPLGRWDAQTKHTVIYYTLLLTGAFGFYQCFFAMTEFKDRALITFDSKK